MSGLSQLLALGSVFGMRIVESPYCELPEPNRRHKKRRNQSESYHRRVQKKWNKRYGTTMMPAAFVFDPSVIGLPLGQTIALHPTHAALIRNIGK